MLKLFFAGSVSDQRSAEIARERARWSAEKAAELREVEKEAERKDVPAYTVLRFGIELNEWMADWFEQAAKSLESDDAATMVLRMGT